jgi:hypothetical protein
MKGSEATQSLFAFLGATLTWSAFLYQHAKIKPLAHDKGREIFFIHYRI